MAPEFTYYLEGRCDMEIKSPVLSTVSLICHCHILQHSFYFLPCGAIKGMMYKIWLDDSVLCIFWLKLKTLGSLSEPKQEQKKVGPWTSCSVQSPYVCMVSGVRIQPRPQGLGKQKPPTAQQVRWQTTNALVQDESHTLTYYISLPNFICLL